MANDVSAIIPRIFAMGVALVRKNSVMPRLVSNKSDVAQAAKGDTVTVPISQKMAAKDAVPGDPSPTDVVPGGAQVQLSQWKDAEFTLTDKEVAEIAGGGPTGVPGNMGGLEVDQWAPAQMVEAVEALVVSADSYALGLFKDVYNVDGTAGTTPFSANLNVMREARRDVNNATTFGRRYCLINPDAAANALARPEIWRANETGSATTIISGRDRYAARCDVGREPKRAGVQLDRCWHAAGEQRARGRRHVVGGRWHHRQHRQAGRQLHHCRCLWPLYGVGRLGWRWGQPANLARTRRSCRQRCGHHLLGRPRGESLLRQPRPSPSRRARWPTTRSVRCLAP